MKRLIAAGAVGAAALAASPAQAVVYPVCATTLAHANAGTTGRCSTDNTPAVSGATARRTVTVEVLAGVAQATVRCGYGVWERSATITVSGPQPRGVSVYEQSSSSCRVELVALYDGTTATAVSTFTYVFIGPGE